MFNNTIFNNLEIIGSGLIVALLIAVLLIRSRVYRNKKRSVLSSNAYPTLTYKMDANRVDLSPKLRILLDTPEKTMMIEHFLLLIPGEERGPLEAYLLQSIKGKNPPSLLISLDDASYLIDHFCPSPHTLCLTWHNISASKKIRMDKSDEISHLRKSLEAMHFVLDTLPVPVWFRDKSGKLSYCNAYYAKALDLPKDKIISQNRLFWGYNSTSFNQEISEPLNCPVKKYLIFEGERRFMEFHETADTTLGIAGYSLDLTDLKKAVSELERHTASYREVLENLSAGVAIYGSDRRVKFFNQAYSRMFDMDENWLHSGPTLGEVLDDLRQRRILPEHADYAAYKKHQMQMINTILNPFQELIHLPDERTLRKIAAPHPLGGIFYIYEDLTDALAVERKYNIQLAVQKASLDNLYEGIAVFGSDGRLRLSNSAYQRIWKLSSLQLKEGMHMSDIIENCKHFFDQPKLWNLRKEKLISLATDRIPKKKKIFREDGSVVDFSYHPLPDGSHLMSCIDVTDSFKVETMLNTYSRSKSSKAARSDRLPPVAVGHSISE